jgi:hypothetical protein
LIPVIDEMTVTEYAPDAFAFLRLLDGYQNKDFKKSLNIKENMQAIKDAGEGEGKSGAFFIVSKDKKFLIKTMSL